MIHCYTGDGKGKTTAALGLAVRAVGAGLKVVWVAFDKGGQDYSERKTITERLPEIEFHGTGLRRFDPVTRKFRHVVDDDDRREGERGLKLASKLAVEGSHDLIVLDEINIAASLGIVPEKAVQNMLETIPNDIDVVLTGRNAPSSFIDLSDLVTEMKEINHPFRRGVPARKGIDY